MNNINLNINNEYGRLTHVVMGTGLGYHRNGRMVEIVNETQKSSFDAGNIPTEDSLLIEFEAFKRELEENGVHVYQPNLAPDSVQDQTCPRDIGFVIGDVLVIASMSNPSRKEEFVGIKHLRKLWHGSVLNVPNDVFLEGGDVIMDQGRIFVGYGQRTKASGVEFMQTHFGDKYQIVPMACRSLADGEDILHLDCTFQPLGLGHALIYPQGLAALPAEIAENYSLIEINRNEAKALATNILSIKPDTLIARSAPDCARVNAELRNLGYTVIEIPFDLVPSTGGSFRCTTLPVRRV